MAEKILNGIKVVEMASYLAGPTCARVLGDWGADVIKVEGINGDPVRVLGMNMMTPIDDDENPVFFGPNVNKRIISINQRTQEGKEIMQKLLSEADVFITSFRDEALANMGLDYTTLSAKYPRLIFAHILGYGAKGPDAKRPGFDFTAYFARSGLMADLADKGGNPTGNAPGFGDFQLAMFLAGGISAALYHRTQSGKGDYISTSLYHVGIHDFSLVLSCEPYATVLPQSRLEPVSPIVNAYKCSDGEWFYLGCSDYLLYFPRVCRALGIDEWAENEDYCEIWGMLSRRSEIRERFDGIFATKTRDEWMEIMTEYDVTAEKCAHFGDVIKDEQAWANDFLLKIDYKNGNKGILTSTPVRFESMGLPPMKLPGGVGCDSVEILKELGVSDEDIARFKEERVIACTE